MLLRNALNFLKAISDQFESNGLLTALFSFSGFPRDSSGIIGDRSSNHVIIQNNLQNISRTDYRSRQFLKSISFYLNTTYNKICFKEHLQDPKKKLTTSASVEFPPL